MCNSKLLLDGWLSSTLTTMVKLLALKADFNHFKINSTLLPSPITQTLCPTRSPFMVISGMSDSKSPSSPSRREPREIYLDIPHSRVRSTTTPSITPSTLLQGHKTLSTFSTTNSVPSTVTPLFNCFSVSSSPSCTLFCL